ncbi:MAG TPA: phosphotransferase [Candidatus Limnocylindrales bacterium]|nr:phosphotransferase [Candidatus Limnocylindrales bacterium]
MDLRAWSIRPTAVRRTEHGLNNDSYFVDAAEGQFVARIYRNTADPARVRDEHDLLGRLAMQELPFQTPVPIKTDAGDTLAVLETEDGPRLAALFTRIAGEPGTLDTPTARIAGRALAQLDLALGKLDLPVRPPATVREAHPLVPDPLAAIDDLGLGARTPALRTLIERVDSTHDALAGSLPRQIVHGDFAFINVLIEDGKVTGMLDFEFAGADMRASDLATAMYITTVRSEAAARWKLLDALTAGYRRSLSLDPMEAAAIPELMRRRSAFGLIHWIGRYRQGLAPRDAPLERVARAFFLAGWLDENAARIATIVAGGFKPN